MKELFFEYSIWWLAVCAIAGLAVALFLYYKNKNAETPSWAQWIKAIIRGIVVFALSAFLLGPVFRWFKQEIQKPYVLFYQDNSHSIGEQLTGEALEEYKSSVDQIFNKLSDNFNVERYDFGEKLNEGNSFDFSDRTTGIDAVYSAIEDNYNGDEIAAVFIATDGLINAGKDPLYRTGTSNLSTRLFALGDTTPVTDVAIRRVMHNKIAYLGDQFPVEVDVKADKVRGQSIKLRIFGPGDNGEVKLYDKLIRIDRDNFFQTEKVLLPADKAGVQKYRLSVSVLEDEKITKNNYKSVFIEILDTRKKILLYAAAPHPDIRALRESIEKIKNYEVEVRYATEGAPTFAGKDLLILHQLPSVKFPLAQLRGNNAFAKIPKLFIAGTEVHAPVFNAIQHTLTIKKSGNQNNDVVASKNELFNLFILPEELNSLLQGIPPMQTVFGDFAPVEGSQILFNQKVGKVKTNYPLWIFNTNQGTKEAVIAGEGIWRWKLFEYLEKSEQEIIPSLLNKTIQYLTIADDKRRFRTDLAQNIIQETENVIIHGELYNKNYERINTAEVQLELTDSLRNKYYYTFNRIDDHYQLTLSGLNPGKYGYKAFCTLDGENFDHKGSFTVKETDLELLSTVADHNYIKNLAEKYNGLVYMPEQLTESEAIINDLGEVKPILYQEPRTSALLDFKWIGLALLLLLGIEWFLRRYFGSF